MAEGHLAGPLPQHDVYRQAGVMTVEFMFELSMPQIYEQWPNATDFASGLREERHLEELFSQGAGSRAGSVNHSVRFLNLVSEVDSENLSVSDHGGHGSEYLRGSGVPGKYGVIKYRLTKGLSID